jgi:hypothetical protein
MRGILFTRALSNPRESAEIGSQANTALRLPTEVTPCDE